MSDASENLQSNNQLPRREILSSLRPFQRRVIGIALSQLGLSALAMTLLVAVAVLWFDTVWALSSEMRWLLSRGGIVAAIGCVGLAAWFRSRQATRDRVARQIDNSTNNGGEITAGLQLALQSPTHQNELTQGFSRMATLRAVQLVNKLSPAVVSDWLGIRKATLFLSIVVGSILILAAVIPGLAWHQIQRFAFPAADLPAYTGVEIELSLEKPQILYGEDAYATAKVIRGEATNMRLIIESDRGTQQSLPMLAADESNWQAILSRVAEPATLYAQSGKSRSRKVRLDVKMTPRLLPPGVTITPPTYTRQGSYVGSIPEDGISGLVGTQVEFYVSSNRPLDHGTLKLQFTDNSTETILLAPDPNDTERLSVTGTMTLSKAGEFELTVTDIDGLQSYDSVTGAINVEQDRRPIVRITTPRPMSLATPDIELPVEVLAEDDYGIKQLTLFRSLNGSPARPVEVNADGSPRLRQRWSLPLPSYQLQPGDEIQLFARAEDNDPAGSKGAESPVTIVRIISVQEFQEMMIQRRGAESIQAKYQTARRHMDKLSAALREVEEAQAELEQNPDSEEAKEKLKEKLQAAEDAAREAAQQMEKLSQQAMPIDVDRELAKRLAEMSKAAEKMANELAEMSPDDSNGLSEEQQQEIAEMRKQSGDVQKQLNKQAIEPLKDMQAILPLLADQSRFVQLVERQRDLAERLNSLESAEPPDEATLRRIAELESEQEDLKRALSELLDDIETHTNDLPDEERFQQLKETANKFVQDVRESDAESEMIAAQQELLGSDMELAHQHASRAAEILESFVSQSNNLGNKACENCEASFNPSTGAPKLGDSLQQMMAMMGMKPGSSMKPGQGSGSGFGIGQGNGFAQRFPGPQNVGMYGSLPMPQPQARRGRGGDSSVGVSTSRPSKQQDRTENSNDIVQSGDANGAAMNSLPANYRSKVAEYFRSVSEAVNQSEK